MGVPKRKSSKNRTNRRFRSHKKSIAAAKPCPKCGEPHLPHRVCPSCGTYRGRQVLIISADE
ncbi:MAG: 50S ribosomal protein L32 [Verrucomicrobia bacterium ADurb.Bin345]|nr:MAG: 50S ribosomal protein L32 [Verrucomicrobia bacterium ADurb.Bin345]